MKREIGKVLRICGHGKGGGGGGGGSSSSNDDDISEVIVLVPERTVLFLHFRRGHDQDSSALFGKYVESRI